MRARAPPAGRRPFLTVCVCVVGRYKYEQALQLANGSDLPVKFEVLTANEVSRAGSGSLSFEYHSGTILPRSTLPLKIGFQAESLGEAPGRTLGCCCSGHRP